MAEKRTDALLFLLLAAFWGGSFVGIKFVVRDFPPVFGAMLRVGVALIALTALFKAAGHSLRTPPGLRGKMWLAGFFAQGLPFLLLFWGERSIAPGLAGIINGTVPLWTFLLGQLMPAAERVTARKVSGLLLGLCGITAVFAPLLSFGGTRAELLGASAVLLMSVSYAVGALLNRRLLSGAAQANFRANLFHQHCASFAFLAAASAAAEPWPSPGAPSPSAAALISVLYLGVFSTALAWMIYYHLIREWGPLRAAAVTYVAPVFALFWDFAFFGAVPTRSEVVGVAAILSGVALLQPPRARLNAAAARP